MSDTFYSVVWLVVFSVAFVSVLLMMGYGMGTIFQTRPEFNTLSTFLAPLIFFFPTRMFTEAGARCRRRFFVSALTALCSVGALVALERAYRDPPIKGATETQSNSALQATRADALA